MATRSVYNVGYRAVEHAMTFASCVDAYVPDPMEDQEQEHRDFTYSSETEWDNAEARELGGLDPKVEYVLTDRDVWHKNPFYTGKPGPHPEDDHAFDLDDMPF